MLKHYFSGLWNNSNHGYHSVECTCSKTKDLRQVQHLTLENWSVGTCISHGLAPLENYRGASRACTDIIAYFVPTVHVNNCFLESLTITLGGQ